MPMIDDLHRSIWFAYRRAICADASWDAATAFRTALDIYLRRRPDIDAASACRDAARMIMTRPHGVANRGRVVAAARGHDAQIARSHGPVVAIAHFMPPKSVRSLRR
jgi:hypothetical protein